MTISYEEHERQRVTYLVLGEPRPRVAKPTGRRAKRKPAPAVVLSPEIEARVVIRERWSHKANGTPETHEHVDRVRRRAGSLARLHATGAIDADQLAAAQEIAETYEAIGAAVGVKSSFNMDRVDAGFRPDLAGTALRFGAYLELTYTRWRAEVEGPVRAVLDIVVDDAALTTIARTYRMSDRRARAVLIAALDLWIALRGGGRRKPTR